MNITDKELITLVPGVQIKTRFAGEVTITPFKFTQFPKVINIIKGLLSSIDNLANVQVNDIASLMVAEDGDKLFQLLMLSTGKDKDWLDQLDADEGLEILTATIEQNLDFFNRKIIPSIQSLTEKVGNRDGV